MYNQLRHIGKFRKQTVLHESLKAVGATKHSRSIWNFVFEKCSTIVNNAPIGKMNVSKNNTKHSGINT